MIRVGPALECLLFLAAIDIILEEIIPLHRQRELPNPQKCNTLTELGGCCVYGVGVALKNQPPFFWQVLTTW
jgi:hypothetical protein